MLITLFTLTALAALVPVQGMDYAEHFFVLPHTPLTAQRLDPIVSSGKLSGHVHAIVGGNKFSQSYSYDQTQSSTCSTTAIQQDKSNYWAPQMYIKQSTGVFKLAPLLFAQTYYFFGRKQANEKVTAFPNDFRMLAGDAKRKGLDLDDPAQDAVRFICLGAGDNEQTHEFPKRQCPDGVRAQVHFPNCWNGRDSWLPDSKHVTYGVGRYDSGGICPEGFKTRLPMILAEFAYKDAETYTPGNRMWANGDQKGYSFHGLSIPDYANGWKSGLLQQVIDGPKCTSGFDLKTCSVLGPLVNEAAKAACTYKGQVVEEDIGKDAPVAKLPGENPLWNNGNARRSRNAPSAT